MDLEINQDKNVSIAELIRISYLAGKKVLSYYIRKDCITKEKEDLSPLTEADIASNNIIKKELQKLYPNIPILSEEDQQLPYDQRQGWNVFFLIDPLDGTKSFIKKEGSFTINIALIVNKRPAIGIVYAPALDLLYYASADGAFKVKKNVKTKLSNAPNKLLEKNKIKVVASKDHFNDETKKYIESLKKEYKLVNIGSSLKICYVAEGKADIYPRLGRTMEWDIAAAHAIALFTGRNIYDIQKNNEITYNKPDLSVPFFVVK